MSLTRAANHGRHDKKSAAPANLRGPLAVGTGGAVAHIPATGAATVQLLGTADLHTLHLAEPDEHANSVGYTAGEGGQVWITKDGGATWAKGPNAGQTVLGVDEIGEGHR